MDLLRQLLEQIRVLLTRFSVAQRLTILALCVCVVLSMLILVFWSGGSHYEPLFSNLREVEPDFIGRVVAKLTETGVDHKVEGDVILVAQGQKARAVARLAAENLLPSQKDLWGWVQEDSITETDQRLMLKALTSLKGEVERMVAGVPEVKAAILQFTPPPARHEVLYEHELNAGKASVHVSLKWGKKGLSNESVEAIANLVSHAIPNLPPHNVHIVDSMGRTYSLPDESDPMARAHRFLEMKRQRETYLEEKVRALFAGFAPETLVQVDLTLDIDSTTIKTHELDPDIFIDDHFWTRDETSEETRAAGTPGVNANAPAEIQGGSGATQGTKLHEEERWRDVKTTDTQVTRPPGIRKDATASVIMPLHQYINSYRQARKPEDFTPDEVRSLIEGTSPDLASWRKKVAAALNIPDTEGKIALSAVPFLEERVIPSPSIVEVAGAWLEAHGGQIFLGLITSLALFMMFSAVKRSIPQPEPILIEQEEAAAADEDEEEEDILLTERSLTEAERRALFIKNKVAESVRGDPAAAARLIKGWLWAGRA
ncbi:MAG: hypothetical protein HY722_17235 [Planctomycetes bacterium]|nr:hypothetical protein [Planctomycetota bacterium]